MTDPQAVLSLVTLGVSDLNRSIAFYEALGFQRKAASLEGVGFFQAGACAISVFPSQDLARDADIGFKDLSPAFRGVSLAWNCPAKADVDAAIDRAYRAGAEIGGRCGVGRLFRILLRSRRPFVGSRVQSRFPVERRWPAANSGLTIHRPGFPRLT